jgi:hypothetical protein
MRPRKGSNMNKVIDKKVKKQMVELNDLDKELKVKKKIKFTDLETGQFFFVRFFSDFQITSNIYAKEQDSK